MRDRDRLRALGLTCAGVGAVTESQLIHLCDHGLGTACALDAALRQLGQRRYARCHEEHCRTVLAGCGAGSAADAGCSIHTLVGILLGDGYCVAVGHRVGAYRDETAGLKDLVVGAAVDYEVLDHGECGRTPRLDGDGLAVLELAHVELAGSYALLGTVRMAVDVHRTHTADTLAAVMVESHGLLALVNEVVVQNIHHLEERRVGRDALDVVCFECSLRFGVLLTPYL